jgi:hypothetical protein
VYLEQELANRSNELVFDKHTKYERGLIQGKAQALYAIIHLPDELYELKSLEEINEQKLKELRTEEEDEEII